MILDSGLLFWTILYTLALSTVSSALLLPLDFRVLPNSILRLFSCCVDGFCSKTRIWHHPTS